MKRAFYKFLIITITLLIIFISCTEINLPPSEETFFSRVKTLDISKVDYKSASAGGQIIEEGKANVISRGVCWDISSQPDIKDSHTTDGSGTGDFTSLITNLNPATVYYIRAYANSDIGTSYGIEKQFKTDFGTISDIDGNTYKTIEIGTQVWTQENLKVTHYANGDAIDLIEDKVTWSGYSSGAYCNYNNDLNNSKEYGRLYNWFSVIDYRGICPEGWHVPSDGDWITLSEFFGGDNVSGTKIKQKKTDLAESYFAGIFGGFRNSLGSYYSINQTIYWWSSTNLVRRYLDLNGSVFKREEGTVTVYSDDTKAGFSVRCIKGEKVNVKTNTVTNVTDSSASCGGLIINAGIPVLSKGVCWNSKQNIPPTVSDNISTDGQGDGAFTSSLIKLDKGTTYNVRAYISSSSETIYGNLVTFKTVGLPSIQTTGTSSVTSISATITGYLVNDGGSAVITSGICWSLKQNPTISDSIRKCPSEFGTFSINISGLMPDSVYYIRAFASNRLGTAYGNLLSFKMASVKPSVSTSIKSISSYSAVLSGNVTADGGYPVTSRGICWGTVQNPSITGAHTDDGTGIGIYESSLAGLAGGTKYYARGYASNSSGTSYGNEITFTTKAGLPVISSSLTLSINSTSVNIGYGIISDGGSTVFSRGICWNTSPNVSLSTQNTDEGSGTGTFYNLLEALSPNTTYYVRAYATNLLGTVYTNEESFNTQRLDFITDIDGNVYNTIQIGTQVWMKENLKTTKYVDGSSIPNITDNTLWSTTTTGAYCFYNNDIKNNTTYGALYNYYTVLDNRKLCPSGWHVPSEIEWNKLISYLGGYSIAGGKLRVPIVYRDYFNSSRFSARLGGERMNSGSFNDIEKIATFWSYKDPTPYPNARILYLYDEGISSFGPTKNYGISVRCLKDNL